jgi:hypothetical protein
MIGMPLTVDKPKKQNLFLRPFFIGLLGIIAGVLIGYHFGEALAEIVFIFRKTHITFVFILILYGFLLIPSNGTLKFSHKKLVLEDDLDDRHKQMTTGQALNYQGFSCAKLYFPLGVMSGGLLHFTETQVDPKRIVFLCIAGIGLGALLHYHRSSLKRWAFLMHSQVNALHYQKEAPTEEPQKPNSS